MRYHHLTLFLVRTTVATDFDHFLGHQITIMMVKSVCQSSEMILGEKKSGRPNEQKVQGLGSVSEYNAKFGLHQGTHFCESPTNSIVVS